MSELPENEIKSIINKRKWKKVAEVLDDKNLEKEPEEDDHFSKNYKESLKKYSKKLKSKWDETGQIEFTPFNMKEEMQEGDLDDDGNFLRKKSNKMEYDPWYESVKAEVKKKEYVNFLNKQREKENTKNQINEESNDESDQDPQPTNKKSEKFNKDEKFFQNAVKIPKNKKKFKFINDEEESDDQDVGEFFKENFQLPSDKYETKKQIKRLRIKLIKLLEEDETVEKTLQILKKKIELSKPKKTFQKKKKNINNKTLEDDILIENISKENKNQYLSSPEIKGQSVVEDKNLPSAKDNTFNDLLEIISKLTDLQHYSVYSDSAEKIEKDYPMIKYEYFYRTEYKDKERYTDQDFGPFDWESITEWVDNNLLNDTDEYKISFKINGKTFETNWFDRNDANYKIYL